LLPNGVPEVIALLAQASQNLNDLVAGIGLHLGELAFKRRHCGVHFIEALLCPICKEVDIALRSHCSSP
jgi:hypothetical protein